MKKRIISLILAVTFILCSMPLSASAAAVNKSVTNSITDVKTHITITGTRYFTYKYNGMNVDSRNVGSKWNVSAFENMNESDRRKVALWYLPGADRTEQFGKDGVQKVVDYINDKSGWTNAWTVMRNRIGEKYLKELRPFYGGNETEGDPDSFFTDEIVRLTTYNEGTPAYRVFNEFGNREESEEIIALNTCIPEMMDAGRDGYKACVNAYYQSISAGTKALSTYTLNLIVDNCIVPGTFMTPSATMAGVRTAGYTLILTTRNFIRDSVSKIVGYSGSYIDEEARQAVAGGSGADPSDAVDIIKRQKVIIDENYKLAKYCHDQAVLFRNTIDSKAQGVIDQIEANDRKKDERSDRIRGEKSAQEEAVQDITNDLTRTNTYYSRIMAKKPTANPSEQPELYEQQEQAYYNEITACWNDFDAEFTAWQNKVSADINGATGQIDFWSWMYYDWENNDMENFDKHPAVLNDTETQATVSEANSVIQFFRSEKSKRDTAITALNNLYSLHENNFENLYSKAIGIVDACGYGDINKYRRNGESSMMGIVESQNNLQLYKDGYYVRNRLEDEGKDYFDLKIKLIQDNLALLDTLRAEYKKNTEQRLDDYLKLQTADDMAREEYNKTVEERNEILESLPDYVKNQTVSNYNFTLVQYEVDTSELFMLSPKNPTLNERLNELTADLDYSDPDYYNKRTKRRNAFFKSEADKLEAISDRLRTIDRKLDRLRGITTSINNAHLSSIVYRNNLYEEDLTAYGIDPKNMHYGTNEALNTGWFCAENDKQKTALKLLLSDFRGTGVAQLKFMDEYNNYKKVRSASIRAVAGGGMSAPDFRNKIYNPMNNACIKIGSSNYYPTYVGANINIGSEDEIHLQDIYDDEDSEVQKLLEISENPESYVPVESLKEGMAIMSGAYNLTEGDSMTLNVSVVPANATFPKIIWESLSPETAEVDENGRVTAISEGTAVIRAIADDSPLTEIKDENNNVTAYEVPDEFVKEFTVTVGSTAVYSAVSDEEGYLWANCGTEDTPRFTLVNTDKNKKTVSARFKSDGSCYAVIMAVYSKDNKLIGASVKNSMEATDTVSVTFDKNKKADRVKIFTWLGTDNMKPQSIVITENID